MELELLPKQREGLFEKVEVCRSRVRVNCLVLGSITFYTEWFLHHIVQLTLAFARRVSSYCAMVLAAYTVAPLGLNGFNQWLCTIL